MIVVVVFALMTVWLSVSSLPLKFASPTYVAVNVRAPMLVRARVHVPDATVPVQVSAPPLTVTTTLPVGVPAPGATGWTVKLTATGVPNTDASGVSAVIVVVVLALLTFNVNAESVFAPQLSVERIVITCGPTGIAPLTETTPLALTVGGVVSGGTTLNTMYPVIEPLSVAVVGPANAVD